MTSHLQSELGFQRVQAPKPRLSKGNLTLTGRTHADSCYAAQLRAEFFVDNRFWNFRAGRRLPGHLRTATDVYSILTVGWLCSGVPYFCKSSHSLQNLYYSHFKDNETETQTSNPSPENQLEGNRAWIQAVRLWSLLLNPGTPLSPQAEGLSLGPVDPLGSHWEDFGEIQNPPEFAHKALYIFLGKGPITF